MAPHEDNSFVIGCMSDSTAYPIVEFGSCPWCFPNLEFWREERVMARFSA